MFLRNLIALLVVSLTLVATTGPAPGAEPVRLRVLSYNIHHGEGVDGKLDLERIAAVIRAENPDIVALQEVDRTTLRTNQVDQLAELARLTRMEGIFGGNIEFQGGDYGNAVLTRLPVERQKNHALPRFDDGEQRGVLEVGLDVGTEKPLMVLATHLDHRRANKERVASAEQINQLVRTQAPPAAILAGDLNDVPDSEPLQQFASLWTRTNREAAPTIPVAKPTRQIDYILLYPADRWNVIETRVLDEAVASDHRAILAVVELTSTGKSD